MSLLMLNSGPMLKGPPRIRYLPKKPLKPALINYTHHECRPHPDARYRETPQQPRIKIAALIKNAQNKALAESMAAKWMAIFLPSSLRSNALVCTMLECKYKLCGMTVAPKIPMAIYNMSGLVTISGLGNKLAKNNGMKGLKSSSHKQNSPRSRGSNLPPMLSMIRNPLYCKNKITITSNAVKIMPMTRGR